MTKHDKIKLIALDIDGTIMDKNFHISDAVKNSVKKAIDNGIKVVLATGRMFSATLPVAQEMGIKTPLITYQGSLIKEYNPSSKILQHLTIKQEIAKELIEDLRKYDVQINTYINDDLIVEDSTEELLEYSTKRHIPFVEVTSFDEIKELSPTKIIIIDNDTDKIQQIEKDMQAKYADRLYVTRSTPIYCEFVNKEISKAQAISLLAKQWDIKQSEIMVIGDQDNDKEMVAMAGLGVAMGNATEGLKEIADYITDSVDMDGAAKAINKFALGVD